MRYYLTALAGLGLASAAVPASAMIVIFDSPGAVQPDENVLFKGAPPSGNNAFGVTNKSNTGVTFTGNEALVIPSKGQARLQAADGGLSQLAFMLTDPTLGFKEVEFNIFGTKATATSVTLNFLNQFGTTFGDTFTINNGQNFFSARALDDQFITNVSFLLDGDVANVRQFRIGGIGEFGGDGSGAVVPEPESWMMLIAGFGLVGTMARRRKALLTVSA